MAGDSAIHEPPLLRWLSLVNRGLCAAARQLAGLLMIVMTAVVLVQIVFRYVLNDSLIWTEEVSKTLMVWTAFLVAPWAYRYGANVRIEMFVDAIPTGLRKFLHLLLNVLVIWILATLFAQSFGMVSRGFSIRAASLPLPVGWFFLIVPAAFGAMILVGAELIIRDFLAITRTDRDFRVPGSEQVRVKEGE